MHLLGVTIKIVMKKIKWLLLVILYVSVITACIGSKKIEQNKNLNETELLNGKSYTVVDVDYNSLNDLSEIIKGNQTLADFLKDIKKNVAKHKWNELQTLCSPYHYQMQTELGLSKEQYLIEIMGLNYVGNVIEFDGEWNDKLNKIKRIKYVGTNADGKNDAFFTVYGFAKIKGESKKRIELKIERKNGKYYLLGALG